MTKKAAAKTAPETLNVTELARYYATSRNTVQSAIARAQLKPNDEGRYDVWAFERAVEEHCPNLIQDTERDAGLWRKFGFHDVQRFVWRRRLQERGYDPSA